MDDASFLAAIAAAPEDRALRLVYADWLEDRGDERSEFIRVCEELESLPPWDARRAHLRPRWRELRARQSAEWLEATGYWPTYRPLFGVMPAERPLRWNLARDFIETWLDCPPPPWGVSDEHIASMLRPNHRDLDRFEQLRPQANVEDLLAERQAAVPASVLEWLQGFGNRMIAGDLAALAPHSLSMDFQQRRLGITSHHFIPLPASSPDPAIYHAAVPSRLEASTASEYFLFWLVYAAIKGKSAYSYEASLPRDSAHWNELEQTLRYTAFHMQGPISGATRFAEGKDLISMDYGGRGSPRSHQPLFVYAKSAQALTQLSPELRALLQRA